MTRDEIGERVAQALVQALGVRDLGERRVREERELESRRVAVELPLLADVEAAAAAAARLERLHPARPVAAQPQRHVAPAQLALRRVEVPRRHPAAHGADSRERASGGDPGGRRRFHRELELDLAHGEVGRNTARAGVLSGWRPEADSSCPDGGARGRRVQSSPVW